MHIHLLGIACILWSLVQPLSVCSAADADVAVVQGGAAGRSAGPIEINRYFFSVAQYPGRSSKAAFRASAVGEEGKFVTLSRLNEKRYFNEGREIAATTRIYTSSTSEYGVRMTLKAEGSSTYYMIEISSFLGFREEDGISKPAVARQKAEGTFVGSSAKVFLPRCSVKVTKQFGLWKWTAEREQPEQTIVIDSVANVHKLQTGRMVVGASEPTDGSVLLPAFYPIPLLSTTEVNFRDGAAMSSLLYMAVARDCSNGGKVVIPSGSKVTIVPDALDSDARIVNGTWASVVLPNGDTMRIRGTLQHMSGDRDKTPIEGVPLFRVPGGGLGTQPEMLLLLPGVEATFLSTSSVKEKAQG